MTDRTSARVAPGAWPLVGHALSFARRPQDFLAGLPSHGGLVQVRLGPLRAYVVCDPNLVNRVLVNDRIFDKGGFFIELTRKVVGNSLITCPYADHRRQRRLLQQAFSRERIAGYAAVMSQQLSELLGNWRDGQVVDMSTAMNRLTANVMMRTLITTTAGDSTIEEFNRCCQDVVSGVGNQMRILLPILQRVPTPSNRRFSRAKRRMRELTAGFIRDHQRGGAEQDDLLSILIAAHKERSSALSEEEIHDQVLTFAGTAVETIADLLCSALHLIGARPQAQAHLQAEADAVLGGRIATYDDIPQLAVTSRIISETLRLWPPLWMSTRITTADTTLGEYAVPAGSTVIFSPYLMGRRADLHPKPDRFDPDRWQNDYAARLPRGADIRFGGGPRRCIGDAFGATEATLTLASIAARWEVEPVGHVRVRRVLRATLAPHPLSMRLHARRLSPANPSSQAHFRSGQNSPGSETDPHDVPSPRIPGAGFPHDHRAARPLR